MKKKNLGIICACLALCGMAVTGTYAWLTAQAGPLTNYFTSTDSQKIKIEVTEDNFNQDEANKYIPGAVFAKNPTVKNISTEESAYVAIKLTYQNGKSGSVTPSTKAAFDKLASLVELSVGETGQWELIDSNLEKGTELYMFKTAVAQGTSASPELFKKVKINTSVEADSKGDLPSFNIKVEGFATQAKHAEIADAKTSLINLANAVK